MSDKIENYRLLSDDDDEVLHEQDRSRKSGKEGLLKALFIALFSLSVILNIVLICTHGKEPSFRSKYGNLEENAIDIPWHASSEYSSQNDTLTDEAWKSIEFDDGMVALPLEFAREKGLPETAAWPWDMDKGIYLLNGYHDLHCAKRIYLSLMQFRDGLPQTLPFTHITHCLDSIRQDIICRADDSPRYAVYKGETGYSGDGQERQCRDWSKLEEWARENSACYRYGNPGNDKISQYERYKYCPSDSPYLPKIRKFFDKGDDWQPSEIPREEDW